MNYLERPREIYSDLIWDVYKFFVGLEKPYIYKISRHHQGMHTYCDGEILYKITDIQIDHGETEYASYSIGEIPDVRDEWVKLEMQYFYEGTIKIIEKKICVNAVNEEDISVNELLKERSLRIPTDEEFRELLAKCTWTKTKLNGVVGYIVTSKVEGFLDKSIFIPNTGFAKGLDLIPSGTGATYGSSSLFVEDPTYADVFRINYDSKGVGIETRINARSIRPVFS